MTYNTRINGWTFHGDLPRPPLVGGILPRNGTHFLVGPKGTALVVAADLAVAAAAGAESGALSVVRDGG